MSDWPLVTGALPVVALALGAGALAGLAWGRGRRWWTRRLPGLVIVAGVTAAAATWVVDHLWRPFPDGLPAAAPWWIGVPLLALGLAVVRPPRSSPTGTTESAAPAPRPSGDARRRAPLRWVARHSAAVAAALVVILATAVQVNVAFGSYPTLATALGMTPPNQVSFTDVADPASPAAAIGRKEGRPLDRSWTAPAGMPGGGVISEVTIPATVSRFSARSGWVYLPPAYLATPRALLPVLVLVSGQPGTPRDWLDGGKLTEVMDRFARAHHGLAPVVVMPDHLGRSMANPMCLDSGLGHAESYLSVDVPAWIRSRLHVDPDPRAWAIAGFSQGGTCALQLAVRAPGVYPTFVDISGQVAPTLGDPVRTAAAAFGGDQAALARVDPLTVLARARYPHTAGMIVAGRDDSIYRPQQQRVLAATRAAGVDAGWLELPGGHSWQVWGPGLEQSLPWLADRLGLTAHPTSPPTSGSPTPYPTGPSR